jgi:PhnB protein
MAVKAIPEGFHTVTPYLIVESVERLIEFVKAAFDAKERFSHKGPDGKIGHAEVTIGDSIVMIGGARGNWKPIPAMIYLYVNDCDATFKRAIAAGAKSVQELTDQFYGDRSGGVTDPCGVQWWIATHKEDVSDEEMARRMKAQFGAK